MVDVSIQRVRAENEAYECDLCHNNLAHAIFSQRGSYSIAICKKCFDNLNGITILEKVRRDRTVKITANSLRKQKEIQNKLMRGIHEIQ